MTYKNLYIELAKEIWYDHGCYVLDDDYLGYCIRTDSFKAFIYIDCSLKYEHKYYVLLHEVGHLFTLRDGELFWSLKDANENNANKFAVKYLDLLGLDSNGYIEFYNNNKKVKYKKGWMDYND